MLLMKMTQHYLKISVASRVVEFLMKIQKTENTVDEITEIKISAWPSTIRGEGKTR
jgi:hypothetical protein